ncbi:MAG TPA: hypothetical protein VGO91_08790 [Pyrinomonadaceae bacterium]|jgi:hypothetical protein|nr:hypothetical protein [Pyrinomonadaceae bacterium]
MKKVLNVFALAGCVLVAAFWLTAQGQTPQPATTGMAAPHQADAGITPNGVIGEVTAINSSAMQMNVKTDAGAVVSVTLNSNTTYKRLAPGEKTLTNASAITLADIGVGDRVFARGRVADDRKSVPAMILIVMTKADIAQKQERERAEWRRRGMLGVITALNSATQEITIQSRAGAGVSNVILPASEKVEFRRYAPDSIKFSDAKPSSFAELKVGDQLRALGERSADGVRFNPEVIVTGSFRTVGGTVTAVNPATGEVKINDLQTKQPLTIVTRQDSLLRRFTPEMAAMAATMASRGAGGPGGPAGGGAPDGTRGGFSVANGNRSGSDGGGAGAPGGQPPASSIKPPQNSAEGQPVTGAAGPGGGPRRGGFDFQEVMDRLPVLNVAELKPGDMVIVSSTSGAEPGRLTAISLVAGVEPLLQAIAARQQQQTGGRPTAPNPANGLGGGINFGIGLP